jgi:hypothetical protein
MEPANVAASTLGAPFVDGLGADGFSSLHVPTPD